MGAGHGEAEAALDAADGGPAAVQSETLTPSKQVRANMAQVLRAEYGDRLPNGLTPERAAPLLVAVMDGLQYQWLLDPDSVDMPGAFRDFLTLLGEG